MPFSVLMSVYRNDKPEFVIRAIESVTSLQTLKPAEIIIIVDGEVDEALHNILKSLESTKDYSFCITHLPENKGLGNALRIGTELASYPIIARMDSDDVAMPNRFEKQIKYLEDNPDCDIVGGQITEFIGSENNIVGKRTVPCTHSEIIHYLKSRCPFNHMTVAFKKNAILSAGGYIPWHYNEDYFLWIRMALNGCKFANFQDSLVNVRIGKEMYARRGGWKYFTSEEKLQRYMLQNHLVNIPQYLYNICGRFALQVLMPNNVRGWLFRNLFRDKI